MPEFGRSIPTLLLRQLRLHQWIKNLLLLVPLGLAHQLGDADRLLQTVWAFFAFSFLASAVYAFNDLTDLESDAAHPRKRHRPLASGELKVWWAVALMIVLIGLSILCAWQVQRADFAVALVLYAILSTAYSLWLKRLVLIDVVVLSVLYTLRVIAGGYAATVEVSSWLLIFSIFLFSSLAFLKRYTELLESVERDGRNVSGRGYHVGDVDFVGTAGVALGFLAILVFAFYVGGDHVQQLYRSSERLWVVMPLLLYWVGRLWLAAFRGNMTDDPIVYALRDPGTYVIGSATVGILWWASL